MEAIGFGQDIKGLSYLNFSCNGVTITANGWLWVDVVVVVVDECEVRYVQTYVHSCDAQVTNRRQLPERERSLLIGMEILFKWFPCASQPQY